MFKYVARAKIKEECKRKIVKQKLQQNEGILLREKFDRDTKALKTEGSWGCLLKGDLKREMMHCLLHPKIRRQIPTRYRTEHNHQIISDICRLYKEEEETMTHETVSSERLQEASRQSVCIYTATGV